MFGSEVTKHSTTIEALHLHIRRRYYYITLLSFFSLVTLDVIAFSGTSKNADVVNGYLVGLDMGAGNWRLSHWYLPGDNFWLQDALAYAIATRVFGNHPFLMIILPAFAW